MLTRYPHSAHAISAIGASLCNRRRMGKQTRPETAHRRHASRRHRGPTTFTADAGVTEAGKIHRPILKCVTGIQEFTVSRFPVHQRVTSPLYRALSRPPTGVAI